MIALSKLELPFWWQRAFATGGKGQDRAFSMLSDLARAKNRKEH